LTTVTTNHDDLCYQLKFYFKFLRCESKLGRIYGASVSVCLPVCQKTPVRTVPNWLNIGSHKQHHMIAQAC